MSTDTILYNVPLMAEVENDSVLTEITLFKTDSKVHSLQHAMRICTTESKID